MVHKVPGNFHISSHAFHGNIYTVLGNDMSKLDLSHTINHLSFGNIEDVKYVRKHFDEGATNPLDRVERHRPEKVKEA